MKAVTLFSSAGIGDIAIKTNGIDIIVANELLKNRALLHKNNFPNTEIIVGDIWNKQQQIIETTKKITNELDFLFATPPCQGMSKNGQGKLLQGIREGKKPEFDVRNKLIIPTMNIITALKPKIVFFENVPEMKDTIILDENNEPINVLEYIKKRLGDEYVGKSEVVQFADYGVPQRRTRLITIYSKDAKLKEHFSQTNSFLTEKTHSKSGEKGTKKWVTVRDKTSNLPKLDSKNKSLAVSKIPFHRVSVLDDRKYFWIENTPPEKGAFDNQCINPKCLYQFNPTHNSTKGETGINSANKETPLYCVECNSLLPRPATIDKKTNEPRIMSGYTSAYKRMAWDLPSATLTTNLSYPSSDQKLHPEQNRVLSLYEAFLLHTLDEFDYYWEISDGIQANDSLIRDVIGESIPPKAIYLIVKHLTECLRESVEVKNNYLFAFH
jgi:DNA (cytosine-5)-methyltransferase 1